MKYNYSFLLRTPTKDKWKKIGIRRRAGVAVPLFSIYSGQSIGIGDINDLKILIDWCKETGLTILQLLPLYEVGYDFSPYAPISSFAIEPMYISLVSLSEEYGLSSLQSKLKNLSKKFNNRTGRVDYRIKNEKLKILKNIYQNIHNQHEMELDKFIFQNKYWLKDYALFKSFIPDPSNVKMVKSERIKFYYWLQWNLYKQLKAIKKYARRKGILLMGDMPLLVSRNSADVWSKRKFFKMNCSAGSPPDAFYKSGQLWGMPTYNWNEIEKDDYKYLKERRRYTGNFFDMLRIDHFIGLFRIWAVNKSSKKKKGFFDPQHEQEWEEHGKKIINAMIENTNVMPTAEDLGTVPECSPKVLKEYGICGMDWQRTLRSKTSGRDTLFKPYEEYRKNSIAVISTHDSSSFSSWWNYEIDKKDKVRFIDYLCRKIKYTKNCSPELIDLNLETINLSASIFSIQLLQEWLCLDTKLFKKMERKDYRINLPGIVSGKNWTLSMPLSLEKMLGLKINGRIADIVKNSNRSN